MLPANSAMGRSFLLVFQSRPSGSHRHLWAELQAAQTERQRISLLVSGRNSKLVKTTDRESVRAQIEEHRAESLLVYLQAIFEIRDSLPSRRRKQRELWFRSLEARHSIFAAK